MSNWCRRFCRKDLKTQQGDAVGERPAQTRQTYDVKLSPTEQLQRQYKQHQQQLLLNAYPPADRFVMGPFFLEGGPIMC